jgi:hypothetical protein
MDPNKPITYLVVPYSIGKADEKIWVKIIKPTAASGGEATPTVYTGRINEHTLLQMTSFLFCIV